MSDPVLKVGDLWRFGLLEPFYGDFNVQVCDGRDTVFVDFNDWCYEFRFADYSEDGGYVYELWKFWVAVAE